MKYEIIILKPSSTFQAALRESVVEVEYQCTLEKTNALLSGVSDMLDVQSERYQTLLYNQKLLNITTALFDAINTSKNKFNITEYRLQMFETSSTWCSIKAIYMCVSNDYDR